MELRSEGMGLKIYSKHFVIFCPSIGTFQLRIEGCRHPKL